MKRIVSALMSVLLVFSCIGVSVAASFPDIETDWAINEIEYMVSKGILNGYPEDGTFKPTQTVTRAEFIKMMCETFGLTATTAINYSDVKTGDWFYPYIQKAAAQGFLLNYGSALNPNGQLSRQEAAALLVRYLDLDPANAAPSSTYPDYAKIKTAYREYVLQATAEGLFQGRDNGNFDPDATLQRREAAAILHRAVGTIYRSSQEGTDLTAAAGNAVITTSGVTVRDARVTDRMIITEGASGGKIVLEDCEIGELIIRGTATVDLDGTDVDSIIVDSAVSGATTYITMSSALTIGEVLLKTPGRMEIASRTEIGKLTVEKDAKNSSATGYGTVNTLYVYADGFEADKVPTTYELSSGITAEFNNTKYSGSSTSAATTGFTQLPSTYASASSCFLTSTAISSGRLYYYYTFNATAPSKTTFDSFYEAAAVKGDYTVTKSALDKNTGSTVTVAAYPYVVVMLRDNYDNAYNPVVITNRSSSGFTVAPEVTALNSYHYLAYTAGESGTLYYYYTNNSEPLTVASFTSTYKASTTSYKSTVDVIESTSVNTPLFSTASVTNYAYVAVMLEDEEYECYQPILVPVKATVSLGNGFSVVPKCSLIASGIAMSFTAANAGTLQYYLTTSNVAPSVAQFDTNLTLTEAALTGAVTVSAGSSSSLTVGGNVSASSYPYMVVRLTSGTTRYTPVVISTSGVSVDMSGTGFNSIPVVTVEDGYYYLTLNTAYPAKVYYYLTNNENAASSDTFLRNYDSIAASNVSSPSGGYMTTYGYSMAAMSTGVRAVAQSSYNYMAIMMSVGAQNYKPICVPLPATSNDMFSAEGIFLTGPYYVMYSNNSHQVEFATTTFGEVFAYYTSDPSSLNVSELIPQLRWGRDIENQWGYRDVLPNTDYRINFTISGDDEFLEYVAVIFVDEDDIIYNPIILTTDGSSAPLEHSGFQGDPTVSRASSSEVPTVTARALQSGNVYYYFTSGTQAPQSPTEFWKAYNSTASYYVRGSFEVNMGNVSEKLETLSSPAQYSYVVFMFQTASGGTGGYGKPVIVRINGTGSSSSLFSTNAFNGVPLLINSKLHFTPNTRGILYYSFANSDDVMEWLSPAIQLQGISGMGTTTPSNLSRYICNSGGGSYYSINTIATQSIDIFLQNYTYLVVWMVTADDIMTAPEFIPLDGTGNNNVTMPSYGTGFYSEPLYVPTGSYRGYVTYTTYVDGYVLYFYANNNTMMSSSAFRNQHQDMNEEYKGIDLYTPGETRSIYIGNENGSKYLWICLFDYQGINTYTPVCIQIS